MVNFQNAADPERGRAKASEGVAKMPRRRATLPHPTRIELYRTTVAAAALLALTTSAFSQAPKQNTAVLNTLQPHSVRTSLRTFHEEAAEPPKLQTAALSQANTQDNPRGVC